jgi:hypothetical protein
MGRPFLTPQNIPADRLAALRDAFDKSMADPLFKAEADKMKLEYSHVSGKRIEETINHLYALPKPIIEKASAAIERTDRLQISKKAPESQTVKAALTEADIPSMEFDGPIADTYGALFPRRLMVLEDDIGAARTVLHGLCPECLT